MLAAAGHGGFSLKKEKRKKKRKKPKNLLAIELIEEVYTLRVVLDWNKHKQYDLIFTYQVSCMFWSCCNTNLAYSFEENLSGQGSGVSSVSLKEFKKKKRRRKDKIIYISNRGDRRIVKKKKDKII